MTKHINLQKNYSLNQSGYQLKLPLNIETIILEYDEKTDAYICRNNKKLSVDYIKHVKSKTGYMSEKTIYKCENGKECPYEGSFGDLKQDMQFRRYLSKGTANVLAENPQNRQKGSWRFANSHSLKRQPRLFLPTIILL